MTRFLESVQIKRAQMWGGIIFLLWGKQASNAFCSCRLCLPLGPGRVFSELIMDLLCGLLEISVFQGFMVFSPWRAFVPCHCHTVHNWLRPAFCTLSGWPILLGPLLTKNAYRFSSAFSLCCIVWELKMYMVPVCYILHLVTWVSVSQSYEHPALCSSSSVLYQIIRIPAKASRMHKICWHILTFFRLSYDITLWLLL